MTNQVDVAVMIGSGVPKSLRALGQKACWVVLVNGEQRGTATSTWLVMRVTPLIS